MEDKRRKCWDCRRRRLVCDLARPGCSKCQSAGRSCPGYGSNKPLKWMQPPDEINFRHAPRRQLELASSSSSTDGQESGLDSNTPSTTSTAEGPVPPLGRQDERPDDICQGSTEQVVFMSDPCALKIQHELAEVFESVEYWNTVVCPDLVATGKGGQANPFFLPTCIISQLPRSALLTVVSTAIGHRLLQSHSLRVSAFDRSALTTKLHHHRGESIRALTADLAEQDKQLSDATLGAVLALLLLEIQQTCSPSWQHHLRGASTIINLRGGFGYLILTNPSFRFVYRYYAIIDIMSTTTTPNPSLSTTHTHLLLLDLLPILYGNGLHTAFPCPPSLFALIIRINHLRAQFSPPANQDGTRSPHDRHTCALSLLHQIQSCGPTLENWALAAAFDFGPNDFGGWYSLARIFQCAVTVYCVASLLYDATTTTTTTTATEGTEGMNTTPSAPQALLAGTRKTLLHLLRKVETRLQLRKMLLWPVVVAGIGAESEEERLFVEGELGWISRAAGTAGGLVAKGFLRERVWTMGRDPWKGGWDGVFEGCGGYLFAI